MLRKKCVLPFAFPAALAVSRIALVGVVALAGTLAASTVAGAAGNPPCDQPYNLTFKATDFKDEDGQPNDIDNPYFPLTPGTKFIYEGESEGERERAVVEVTSTWKTILGVRAVVVRDQVTVDGELVELAFDWHAQDKHGNVWYLGEDVTNYENGQFKDKAGSWEAGKNGAKPGIIMKARPRVGESYRQEYAPGLAEDAATVLSRTKRVSVRVGSFRNVLQTRDFSCFEPVDENKYYAQGIGLIKAVARVNGQERPDLEVLELVKFKPAGDSDEDDQDD